MCGIFGWVKGKKCKATTQELYALTKGLAKASEVRGTDASGVGTYTQAGLSVKKKDVKGGELEFPKVFGKSLVGHTRATTQGSEKLNYNNHPFYPSNKKFVMAHNGVIYNDTELRVSEKLDKTLIETDSYIITQVLNKYGFKPDGMKKAMELLDGSFALPIATQTNDFYFVAGGNPIELFYSQEYDLYIYASTTKILFDGISEFIALYDKAKQIGYHVVKNVEELPTQEFTLFTATDGEVYKISRGVASRYVTFEYDEWKSFRYGGWNTKINKSEWTSKSLASTDIAESFYTIDNELVHTEMAGEYTVFYSIEKQDVLEHTIYNSHDFDISYLLYNGYNIEDVVEIADDVWSRVDYTVHRNPVVMEFAHKVGDYLFEESSAGTYRVTHIPTVTVTDGVRIDIPVSDKLAVDTILGQILCEQSHYLNSDKVPVSAYGIGIYFALAIGAKPITVHEGDVPAVIKTKGPVVSRGRAFKLQAIKAILKRGYAR